MDIFDAIYKRRSLRRFVVGEKIPEDQFEQILDTIQYVPSPLLMVYPWRFIVVRDENVKKMLGGFGQETARVLFGLSEEIFKGHLWYMPPETKKRKDAEASSGDLWKYPAEADVVIIPCWARASWGTKLLPMINIPYAEICSSSLGMTCENMWLAATSFGIGCALNAMPLNDPRKRELIADVIGLPHSWELLGAFSFGLPREHRIAGPSRGPLEGAVYDEHWGNNYVRIGFRDEPLELGKTPKIEIFKTIKAHKQVMKFKKEKVPEWKIERILDTARWAPNPENLQHTRYIISRDENLKKMLTGWNMEILNMLKTYQLLPNEAVKGLEPLMEFPLTADTLIIPITTRSSWLDYPFSPGNMGNYIFWGASGHSIQNMCLSAIALGLGTNYNISPVMDNRREELLCEYLGIPRSWDPMGILYVGVPEDHISYGRPLLNELIYKEHWGNPYYE